MTEPIQPGTAYRVIVGFDQPQCPAPPPPPAPPPAPPSPPPPRFVMTVVGGAGDSAPLNAVGDNPETEPLSDVSFKHGHENTIDFSGTAG